MPDLDLQEMRDLRGAAVSIGVDAQALADALGVGDLARAQKLTAAIADRADAFVAVLGAPVPAGG